MRFVVATLPDLKFALGRDLNLVKACVLYGDETSLFSPTFTGTEPFIDFSKRSVLHQVIHLAAIKRDPGFVVGEKFTKEQLDERTVRAREGSVKLAIKALNVFQLMSDPANCSQAAEELTKLEREIQPMSRGVEDIFAANRECIERARQLCKAERLGLITIKKISDSPLPYYNHANLVSEIGTELSRPDSYGALDERFVGNFDGLGNGVTQKFKVPHASDEILQTLPGFSSATFEEIRDIRSELVPHLAPFRKALVEISGQIRSMPWNDDFPHEVERELRLRLYPAVSEIESQIRKHSFLRELAYRVAKNPLVIPASSAFGMLLSTASSVPTAVASGLAGAGLLATEAYKEWKDSRAKAEGNQFFFYYRARALLKKQRQQKKVLATRTSSF
jgi:hypothetical protein